MISPCFHEILLITFLVLVISEGMFITNVVIRALTGRCIVGSAGTIRLMMVILARGIIIIIGDHPLAQATDGRGETEEGGCRAG